MPAPIVLTFEFGAPPARVFDAWTRGDQVKSWWRVADQFKAAEWKADLKPGGPWHIVFRGGDGAEFEIEGTYREVQRPARLAFTWSPAWDDDPPTNVRFDLVPHGAGTRLTVTHDGFASEKARADNAEGWIAPMAMVGAYLDGR